MSQSQTGFTKLYDPKGEPFLMPRGNSIEYYLKKGFTMHAPVKVEHIVDPKPEVQAEEETTSKKLRDKV